MNLLFPDSESYKLLSDCITSAKDSFLMINQIQQKRKAMNTSTPVTEFWTEDKIREFAEYYRKTQGGVPPALWGKDLLEVFKSQHSSSGKDWEVIKVINKGAISFFSTGRGYTIEEIKKDGYDIYQVRRLSDGEMFSIGDQIGWGEIGNYKTTILSFRINAERENRLEFEYQVAEKHRSFCDFIDAVKLHKKAPIPPPRPVFTTDDGVEIFDKKDEVWGIDKKKLVRVTGHGNSLGTWLNGWYCTHHIPNPRDNDPEVLKCIKENFAIFSTEEAANNYIIMHKRCLSVRDVLDIIKNCDHSAPDDCLKALAQYRINK
jgi:hypothetical protein